MDDDSAAHRHKRLVQLIRGIASDVVYEVLDEHMEDYEHKERPAEEVSESEMKNAVG